MAYELECEDTCTGETWESNINATVSGSLTGSAVVPGLCPMVSWTITRPIKSPWGKNRYFGILKWSCRAAVAAFTANQAKKVKQALEDEVFAQVRTRMKALKEQGATEACKMIRAGG